MKTLSIALLLITSLTLSATVNASTTNTLYPIRKPGVDAKITSSMLMGGKVPGVKFRGDVSYLPPNRKEKLDVYRPEKQEPGKLYPAILMIHGGGWVGGNKTARREMIMGAAFAQSGYVAVSVEYEKARGKSWPTNLQDCKNAVRWIRTHAADLQVDPDHIGVIGGSAGGHLSLMVAYTDGVMELEPDGPYPNTSNTVQCCVNLYGITDLTTRHTMDKKTAKPIPNKIASAAIMAHPLADDPQSWKLASPVNYITSQTVPTLILHGESDTTVDHNQAIELDRKLTQVGVEHTFISLPGVGHAFSPDSKELPHDMRVDVINFFDKHLKP